MLLLSFIVVAVANMVLAWFVSENLLSLDRRLFEMSQALEQELASLRSAVANLQREAAASLGRISEDVAELLRRLDEAGEAPTQAQLDEIRALAIQIQEVADSEASQDPLTDFPAPSEE
jgi:uncharacterized protein YoxC